MRHRGGEPNQYQDATQSFYFDHCFAQPCSRIFINVLVAQPRLLSTNPTSLQWNPFRASHERSRGDKFQSTRPTFPLKRCQLESAHCPRNPNELAFPSLESLPKNLAPVL